MITPSQRPITPTQPKQLPPPPQPIPATCWNPASIFFKNFLQEFSSRNCFLKCLVEMSVRCASLGGLRPPRCAALPWVRCAHLGGLRPPRCAGGCATALPLHCASPAPSLRSLKLRAKLPLVEAPPARGGGAGGAPWWGPGGAREWWWTRWSPSVAIMFRDEHNVASFHNVPSFQHVAPFQH